MSITGASSASEALPFFQILQLQESPSLTRSGWKTSGVRSKPASGTDELQWLQPATQSVSYFQIRPSLWHTPFPDLTGPTTRVGYLSRHVTGPGRTGFELGTNRSFMVSVWYPADSNILDSSRPHTLYPPQFGIYLFTKDFITPARPATLVTNLVAQALQDAPLDRSQGPYPVLLYGHGGQWFRHDNAHKAAEMASRGYIVVALDFYDAFMSILPNGQLALDDSATDFPHTKLSTTLHDWGVLDVSFLIDTLEEWNRSDAVFSGMLQMQELGVWGWSFGGAVMADVARVDPRVKAAMLFDAAFWSSPELISKGLQKPFFCLQSEFSPTTDWAVPALGLLEKNTVDAYFLRIAGSSHSDFTDLELINHPTSTTRRYQSHQIRHTAAFFDRYLKQKESPLLEGPAAGDPELISWIKK